MHIVYNPTQHQADDVLCTGCFAVFLNIIWNWPDNGRLLTEACRDQINIFGLTDQLQVLLTELWKQNRINF